MMMIDREELHLKIRSLQNVLGRPPLEREVTKLTDVTSYPPCPDWKREVEKAGLPSIQIREIPPEPVVSESEVLDDVKSVADKTGWPPNRTEYARKHGDYRLEAVYDAFGSWDAAVDAAKTAKEIENGRFDPHDEDDVVSVLLRSLGNGDTEVNMGGFRADVVTEETGCTVAIEAKGSEGKWRHGIGQACTYLAYGADCSYLAVPWVSIEEQHVETCSAVSVGLIGVDNDKVAVFAPGDCAEFEDIVEQNVPSGEHWVGPEPADAVRGGSNA